MQGNWRREAVIAGIQLLLALMIAIVGAELYVRFRYKHPAELVFNNELVPYVMFRSPANLKWVSRGPSPSSRRGQHARVYTNQDSLRVPSPEYQIEKVKPSGQLRIAVLGGSTVQIGTSFEVTLPGALKRLLIEDHPGRDIEVLNAGIVSAVSRQELVFLLTTVVDYHPDIVIIYDGINDSGQMLYFEDRPNYPYLFAMLEGAWQNYVADEREPLWRVICDRSALCQMLWPQRFQRGYRYRTVPPADLIANAGRRRLYADAYIDNWKKIKRVCDGYGIEPIFVLQPTSLYALFPKQPVSDRNLNLYANYLVYEEMRKRVHEFASMNPECSIFDLSGLIPRLDAYTDGAHVYDDVNDEIAAAILRRIEPKVDAVLSKLSDHSHALTK